MPMEMNDARQRVPKSNIYYMGACFFLADDNHGHDCEYVNTFSVTFQLSRRFVQLSLEKVNAPGQVGANNRTVLAF